MSAGEGVHLLTGQPYPLPAIDISRIIAYPAFGPRSIARLSLIAIAVTALSACATPQVPKDRVVEVIKPVAVQPITKDQIPALPPPIGPRPPTAQQAADAAFAAHCADVAWIIRAFPLLEISAGLTPTPAPQFPECERKN